VSLAVVVLLVCAAVSQACTVPPYQLPQYKCSQLPTNFINPGPTSLRSSTWTSPALQHVGNYRGVFNKLLYGGSKPPAGNLTSWLSLQGAPCL